MKILSILDGMSSIASIIELIVVIIGCIYAKKQLDDSMRGRRMQLLREIIDEVGTDEIRKLRKWLYDSDDDDLELEKVKRIAVAYDRISFMLLHDKKALNLFMAFQGNEIIHIWKRVEKSILTIREKRNNPNYCIHFEKLYIDLSKEE